MSGEAWLYLLSVLINAVNLFLQVFFTIMYSDLEWYAMSPSVSARHSDVKLMCCSYSDYINPIDLCNRLNTYIVPEAAVHAFLTFLFLINGYWLALILNLPLAAYNAKKYVGKTTKKSRVEISADSSGLAGSSRASTFSTRLKSSASSMFIRRLAHPEGLME
jgi:hypothetical protein